MTARVSVEDVKRGAELAHLELTPDESRNMLHDLNAILDHVAELSELDTSAVAPLAQVSELPGNDSISKPRPAWEPPGYPLDRAYIQRLVQQMNVPGDGGG